MATLIQKLAQWRSVSTGAIDGLRKIPLQGYSRSPAMSWQKDLTVACYTVGFDPYMGFYHQMRHGRPALALGSDRAFSTLIAWAVRSPPSSTVLSLSARPIIHWIMTALAQTSGTLDGEQCSTRRPD